MYPIQSGCSTIKRGSYSLFDDFSPENFIFLVFSAGLPADITNDPQSMHRLSFVILLIMSATACGADIPQLPAPQDPAAVAEFEARTAGKTAGNEDTDAAAIQRGRELYLAYGCRACHGDLGGGDGPASAGVQPPPRNFRALNTYRRGTSAEAIAATLQSGIPGTLMNAYPQMSAEERRLVGRYVVHLRQQPLPADARPQSNTTR